MTMEFVGTELSLFWKELSVPDFAFFAVARLITDMDTLPYYRRMIEMNTAARTASLGATRQMMVEDEFGALVALLIDCNAVPKNVMSVALDRLARQHLAKARGEMESDANVYPNALFERARSLGDHAARLRRVS